MESMIMSPYGSQPKMPKTRSQEYPLLWYNNTFNVKFGWMSRNFRLPNFALLFVG